VAVDRVRTELLEIWNRCIPPEVDETDVYEAQFCISQFAVAFAHVYRGPISPQGQHSLLADIQLVAERVED
jgi:hypothetical protein